jgi:hypothetical protein
MKAYGEHPLSYPMGIPGAPSPRLKLPGREADHSPPSSVEVKNTWIDGMVILKSKLEK